MVTASRLESMGLVVERASAPAVPRRAYRHERPTRRGERRWPDYQKCLDAAPMNAAGDGPRRATADYTWCMIAADWGFSVQDTVARLIEQSTKAQENGKGYAVRTAVRAAEAAARNQGKQVSRTPAP